MKQDKLGTMKQIGEGRARSQSGEIVWERQRLWTLTVTELEPVRELEPRSRKTGSGRRERERERAELKGVAILASASVDDTEQTDEKTEIRRRESLKREIKKRQQEVKRQAKRRMHDASFAVSGCWSSKNMEGEAGKCSVAVA